MQRRRRTPAWPWLLAAFLLVLLAVLGTLQYRWLGRATEADRQRTASSLRSAAERFASDFDHELAYVVVVLASGRAEDRRLGDDATRLVRRLGVWRERTAWPELVESVWRVEAPGSLRAQILDEDAGRFVGRELPAELLALEGELDGRPRLPFLSIDPPALVVPWRLGPPDDFAPPDDLDRPALRDGPGRRGRHRHLRQMLDRRPVGGYLVLRLDAGVLTERAFPELAARHFSVDEEALVLRVVSGASGEPIWTRGEAAARREVEPVAEAELFSPRRLLRTGGPGGDHREHGVPWHHVLTGGMRHALADEAQRDRPHWRLEVIHPAGSLDAAVATARRGGLALSLGILLVLAVTVLLLAHALRRAQALARRQMDFVAGVTHELRTPLAALRSAGQNLADGLVDGERVARYGRLVEREGRRLEETVDQVLAYAGLGAGTSMAPAERSRLDAAEEARRAVDELAPIFDDEGVEVEIRADDDLPPIRADRAALGRALRNLLVNAVRHGQEGDGSGWVGLDVDADAGEGTVRFRVRDHGPGVAAADRRRIFEPFVRGADLAASNVPGNGLGLALVRRVAASHGGSVRLEPADGGAVFVLELPVDREEPT